MLFGRLAVGQRVWLYLAAAENPYGTAAEFAVVPADKVVPLADNADAAVLAPNATIAVYAGEGEQPRIPILPWAVANATIRFALMYTVSAVGKVLVRP